jgi:hypothetical protein
MADYPVASDLSYLVFQKRRERGELAPCALDSTNQALYPLPCAVVQRETFIGFRGGVSEDEWNRKRQARMLQG